MKFPGGSLAWKKTFLQVSMETAMNDYNLEPGEYVILQTLPVNLIDGNDKEPLDEVVLTDRTLILVSTVSTGLFSSKRYLKRCPLDHVSYSADEPVVMVLKRGDTYWLQASFEGESISLEFPNNPRQEAKRWSAAIKHAIEGDFDSINTSFLPPREIGDFLEKVTGAAKSVGLGGKPSEKAPTRRTSKKCIGCHAPLTGIKGHVVTCEFCGIKQTL